MNTNPTYLGTVQDVRGGTISITLDNNTLPGLSFVEGYGYRIGQIGSFVRIPIGYNDLYGIVSQIGAGSVPEKLSEELPHGNRWMTVQLVGESQRNTNFSRGISQYPTIGDPVHLLTESDLSKIYGHSDINYISIGHLASADSIPALINIDKLITRHSAVVGTTGSGKSTTVAGLLSSLSDEKRFPSSRIIVFDIHGEYSAALRDKANIFKVNPNLRDGEKPLYIPYWAMSFDELMSVTIGDLEDRYRGQLLEKIISLKKESLSAVPRAGVTEDTLTVDTPVPFSIHKFWFDLFKLVNSTHIVAGTGQSDTTIAYLLNENGTPIQQGDAMNVIPPKFRMQNQGREGEKIYLSGCDLPIRRQLNYLASNLRDSRYDFLFKPGPWLPDINGIPTEDLDSLLQSWIGGEHSISILDLSGIPISILTTLIGILLRIIYDALFWSRLLSEGGKERPVLIVLEEAHTYLNQGDNGYASSTVKRIVKEGRKYGIGAMIVSQRPSEIDPTVLSQCGTIFAMRLSNNTDRGHVTSIVSDNLEGLFNMLPSLRTGEAIIVGEAVNLPIRTLIKPPVKNRRPDSCDPAIYSYEEESGGWNQKRINESYCDMVFVWRKQDPHSPNIKTDW